MNAHRTEQTKAEGWKKFSNARLFHYIGADGRSLCGKWAAWGMDNLEPDAGPTDDDCKGCRRVLDRRQKS